MNHCNGEVIATKLTTDTRLGSDCSGKAVFAGANLTTCADLENFADSVEEELHTIKDGSAEIHLGYDCSNKELKQGAALVTCEQFKTSQKEQDNKITELEKTTQAQGKDIELLQQCCENNNQKNGTQDKEIEDIKKRLDALKSKNDNLEAENGKLSNDLDVCRSTGKALQNTIDGLKGDKAALEDKIKRLQSELDTCKANQNTPTPNPPTPTDNGGSSVVPKDKLPTNIRYPDALGEITCGGELHAEGNHIPKSFFMNVKGKTGTVSLDFNPFFIPDAIKIWVDKTVVYESAAFGFYGKEGNTVGQPQASVTDEPDVIIRNVTADGVSGLSDHTSYIGTVNNAALSKVKGSGVTLAAGGLNNGLSINIPVSNTSEYVFIDIIPDKEQGTLWDLWAACGLNEVP